MGNLLAPGNVMKDTLDSIVTILTAEYGSPALSNRTDPVDEVIFILLSEKTDEAKYVAAFRQLKDQFSCWKEMLDVDVSQIEATIRNAGMGKRRAELLQRMLGTIVQRFGRLDLSDLKSLSPDQAETELMRLPGVGRKAARCVLLYCFDFPVLPVDIHTYRLAIRLGILSRRISYEQSHSVLPTLIPEQLRRAFHVNAVAHGRTRCFARNPECSSCPLSAFCSHPQAVNPLPIVVRPKPIAVDLFAGAGGLTLGLKMAGFHIVQAVECDPHATATYRRNNPQVDLLEDDIRTLDPIACLHRLGLQPRDVTVLIGGPPCQGFSESNRRTRTLSNPRNHLYREFIRFLEHLQPAWFVIENVAGLRTLSGGEILRRIVGECGALRYEVRWAELDAADYGVPQHRRRLLIVGNRLKLPIRFPEPTYGSGLRPHLSVRDAISDLPALENGASIDCLPYGKDGVALSDYQKVTRSSRNGKTVVQGNLVTRNADRVIQRYKCIQPGQNWEAIPSELMDNYTDFSRCHTGIYHRLDWDKPSKVIGNFRKNMLIHPDQHRGLSVREAARLQSFPDYYEFVGSIGFQQQQVADAVPPLLARAVADCIRSADRASLDCPVRDDERAVREAETLSS